MKILKNIDVVIHLASLSNDPLGELNKDLYQANQSQSYNKISKIIQEVLCKEIYFLFQHKVSMAYQKYTNKTIRESNDKNIKPITEYAKSKLRAEKELLKLADNKFCVVILRPSTVHGPSENFK